MRPPGNDRLQGPAHHVWTVIIKVLTGLIKGLTSGLWGYHDRVNLVDGKEWRLHMEERSRM